MALTDVYVQTPAQLPELFRQIEQGQAPDQFTTQHLKDLGFTSTNHRAFIPLLKALGFLSPDGKPTQRYHDYRDGSQSRRVLGQGLREAYGDLFVLRARPAESDRPLFEGKFKSAHNINDRLAKLMSSTFYSVLALADVDAKDPGMTPKVDEQSKPEDAEKNDAGAKPAADANRKPRSHELSAPGLHYNIQIHLPATKDIEVFNAIFKSLKEHLLD